MDETGQLISPDTQRGRVSVQWLIDHASFGDAGEDATDWKDKEECLLRKLDNLDAEFVRDVIRNGIQVPICYLPEAQELANGHHRVLTAWLLNIEYLDFDVDIWDDFNNDRPNNWQEGSYYGSDYSADDSASECDSGSGPGSGDCWS